MHTGWGWKEVLWLFLREGPIVWALKEGGVPFWVFYCIFIYKFLDNLPWRVLFISPIHQYQPPVCIYGQGLGDSWIKKKRTFIPRFLQLDLNLISFFVLFRQNYFQAADIVQTRASVEEVSTLRSQSFRDPSTNTKKTVIGEICFNKLLQNIH